MKLQLQRKAVGALRNAHHGLCAIAPVFALLQLRGNFIPVNLNFTTEDPGCIRPYTGGPHREIRHILSNAFGFGGNDTSLILSKA